MGLKIGVIISSTRPTRVGDKVAQWFMNQPAVTGSAELDFELIDLKELDLPFLSEPESASTGRYTQAKTKAWSQQVEALDGFVFITAEYNNGVPAPLKNAIDTIYNEWDRKPAAFVGYGTYGATRAVEQLANITAKVGMVPLLKTFVGIMDPWDSVGQDGSVKPEYVHGRLEKLIENLAWWATLLKAARR